MFHLDKKILMEMRFDYFSFNSVLIICGGRLPFAYRLNKVYHTSYHHPTYTTYFLNYTISHNYSNKILPFSFHLHNPPYLLPSKPTHPHLFYYIYIIQSIFISIIILNHYLNLLKPASYLVCALGCSNDHNTIFI